MLEFIYYTAMATLIFILITYLIFGFNPFAMLFLIGCFVMLGFVTWEDYDKYVNRLPVEVYAENKVEFRIDKGLSEVSTDIGFKSKEIEKNYKWKGDLSNEDVDKIVVSGSVEDLDLYFHKLLKRDLTYLQKEKVLKWREMSLGIPVDR